jgi:hypothetical protein
MSIAWNGSTSLRREIAIAMKAPIGSGFTSAAQLPE